MRSVSAHQNLLASRRRRPRGAVLRSILHRPISGLTLPVIQRLRRLTTHGGFYRQNFAEIGCLNDVAETQEDPTNLWVRGQRSRSSRVRIAITALQFDATGALLASGSAAGELRIFDFDEYQYFDMVYGNSLARLKEGRTIFSTRTTVPLKSLAACHAIDSRIALNVVHARRGRHSLATTTGGTASPAPHSGIPVIGEDHNPGAPSSLLAPPALNPIHTINTSHAIESVAWRGDEVAVGFETRPEICLYDMSVFPREPTRILRCRDTPRGGFRSSSSRRCAGARSHRAADSDTGQRGVSYAMKRTSSASKQGRGGGKGGRSPTVLAVSDRGRLRLWDIRASEKPQWCVEAAGLGKGSSRALNALCVLPDLSTVVVGGESGQLVGWDLRRTTIPAFTCSPLPVRSFSATVGSLNEAARFPLGNSHMRKQSGSSGSSISSLRSSFARGCPEIIFRLKGGASGVVQLSGGRLALRCVAMDYQAAVSFVSLSSSSSSSSRHPLCGFTRGNRSTTTGGHERGTTQARSRDPYVLSSREQRSLSSRTTTAGTISSGSGILQGREITRLLTRPLTLCHGNTMLCTGCVVKGEALNRLVLTDISGRIRGGNDRGRLYRPSYRRSKTVRKDETEDENDAALGLLNTEVGDDSYPAKKKIKYSGTTTGDCIILTDRKKESTDGAAAAGKGIVCGVIPLDGVPTALACHYERDSMIIGLNDGRIVVVGHASRSKH